MSKKAELMFNKKDIFLQKTDLSMAFRVLPLKIICIKWLVMKAVDPRDGKTKFFIEKCLPFGSSISCSHYQRFSNALKHILSYRTGEKAITNYLDDFLFLAVLKALCDQLIQEFLNLCNDLNIPVAVEKTEWGCSMIVFLGILLDGRNLFLSLPLEKQAKALNLLNDIEDRKK